MLFRSVSEGGEEIWNSLANNMSMISAYSFLIFNLLCAPCFAAMGAIKREMNSAKWFWVAIGYQSVLAYVVSLCVFQIGNLLLTGTFSWGIIPAVLLVISLIYLIVRPARKE